MLSLLIVEFSADDDIAISGSGEVDLSFTTHCRKRTH